jgi:hypothetical protein
VNGSYVLLIHWLLLHHALTGLLLHHIGLLLDNRLHDHYLLSWLGWHRGSRRRGRGLLNDGNLAGFSPPRHDYADHYCTDNAAAADGDAYIDPHQAIGFGLALVAHAAAFGAVR